MHVCCVYGELRVRGSDVDDLCRVGGAGPDESCCGNVPVVLRECLGAVGEGGRADGLPGGGEAVCGLVGVDAGYVA